MILAWVTLRLVNTDFYIYTVPLMEKRWGVGEVSGEKGGECGGRWGEVVRWADIEDRGSGWEVRSRRRVWCGSSPLLCVTLRRPAQPCVLCAAMRVEYSTRAYPISPLLTWPDLLPNNTTNSKQKVVRSEGERWTHLILMMVDIVAVNMMMERILNCLAPQS